LFHLCFRHGVVTFFVVLSRHFRLERPCARCRRRRGQNQYDEQSKTRECLHLDRQFILREKPTAFASLTLRLAISTRFECRPYPAAIFKIQRPASFLRKLAVSTQEIMQLAEDREQDRSPDRSEKVSR